MPVKQVVSMTPPAQRLWLATMFLQQCAAECRIDSQPDFDYGYPGG
jgi:hypothetical protein